MTSSRETVSVIGSIVLLGGVSLLSGNAQAACVQTGNMVDCTGVDADGFLSPQTLTVHIRPGAFVQNVISSALIGNCPLSLPAIEAGRSSTVLNEGVISTDGTCGFGIVVGDRATVVNLGTIRTAEFVAHGIIAGDNSAVRNGGSISTLRQTSPGILGGAGVRVITDAGSRIDTSGAASSGIDVGAASAITHNGAISLTGDASLGLNAGNGSVLVNNGSIQTSANNSMGVRVAGGSLINNGSIRSILSGPGFALTPTIGVSIIGAAANFANTASGSVTATHVGVQLGGTQGTGFSNQGRIEVFPALMHDGTVAGNGAAVLIAGGLTADMVNSGAIVAHGGLPAVRSLGPQVDFRNSGTVTGDIFLAGGNDTIAYEEFSAIDGKLDFGAGDDTLVHRAGGIFVQPVMNLEYFTRSGSRALTIGRDLTAAQQVTNFGGGAIVVDRGVRLTATLIENIGTVRGHGTLVSALNNIGTVAPGTDSERGTLTVTGAFRQFPGGQILARLSPDGSSDRVLVGGTATLAGNLVVSYDRSNGGDFFDGQRFDVIAPLGASLATTGELALSAPQGTFVVPALIRTSNGGFAVEIDRRPYESVAKTPSQVSAARLLDRLRPSAPAGLGATLAQLDLATMEGAAALIAGFAPEAPGGIQNLSLIALDRFTKNVRGPAPFVTGRFTWVRAFTGSGRTRGVASPADYDLYGGIAGVEIPNGPMTFGVAVARVQGDFARGRDTVDYDASILGLTARRTWSKFTLDAALAYGVASPRMQRLRLTSEILPAETESNLWSLSANGRFAAAFGPADVHPHLGATYHRAELGAIDERQALAVRTASSTAASLRARGGVAVSAVAGRVRPYGDLSLSIEFLERTPSIGASLIGVSGSDFALHGDARRRAAVEAAAGIAVSFSQAVEGYLAGEFVGNDLLAGRSLSAGVTFRW